MTAKGLFRLQVELPLVTTSLIHSKVEGNPV